MDEYEWGPSGGRVPTRKRGLEDVAVPGGTIMNPQSSMLRMREALAAGGIDGLLPTYNLGVSSQPVMCKYFTTNRNGCSKGNSCPFSHEVNAQPSVPIEQKLRTPCRFFQLGQCMRGSACKYAHGNEEMDQIHQMMRANSKKKGRTDEEPQERPVEQRPEDEAYARSLSAVKGFQDFDKFDFNSSGPTDCDAAGPEKMDSAWADFLSEMDDPPAASGSAVEKQALQQQAPNFAPVPRGGLAASIPRGVLAASRAGTLTLPHGAGSPQASSTNQGGAQVSLPMNLPLAFTAGKSPIAAGTAVQGGGRDAFSNSPSDASVALRQAAAAFFAVAEGAKQAAAAKASSSNGSFGMGGKGGAMPGKGAAGKSFGGAKGNNLAASSWVSW